MKLSKEIVDKYIDQTLTDAELRKIGNTNCAYNRKLNAVIYWNKRNVHYCDTQFQFTVSNEYSYIRPNGVVKYNTLAGDPELLSYLIKKLAKARSR